MSVNNILSTATVNAPAIYTPTDGAGGSNKMAAADIEGVVHKSTEEMFSMNSSINIDKTLKSFITDALKAAGLPVNDRMMELVNSLLERQQPIDKNTLMAYNRLLGQFPGVNPETLITMQKSGLHISKESIEQFENYKNNENQIFRNIDDAAESIGDLVKNLVSENSGKATDLLDALAKFVNDMVQQDGAQMADAALQKQTETDIIENTILQQSGREGKSAILEEVSSESNATNVSDAFGQSIGVDKNFPNAFINTLTEEFNVYLTAAEAKERLSAGNLFEKLSVIFEKLPEDKAIELASKLDSRELAGMAKEALREALFLEPEVAADKDKLTEYYKKLEQSVNEFLNTAKELGDTVNNSALARTFNNVADNVTFMNQINDYMPYIQLPLKLLKEEAHGEFYVMKRRKQQQQQMQQNDVLTAFLRLNMTNLGELDIMVKLKGQALDVDFKAEKTDVVDFIADNLMTLEEKLRSKGYIPSMRASEKEKEFDFGKDFLEAESNESTIGRYSFDMKI